LAGKPLKSTPKNRQKTAITLTEALFIDTMQEDNRVALMALHYLPSIGWFTNLMKYPALRLEKCEHFVKSTGRNRCEIGHAQGRQTLTIPIFGGRGQQVEMAKVKIANDRSWQRQHWHALKTAYGKAPYFEDYAPYFKPFFEKKFDHLWDFNLALLQLCLKLLGLQVQLNFTLDFEKNLAEHTTDFRGQKVLKIADQPLYYQGFSPQTGFLSDLSILDLLFQLGPQSRNYLQTCLKQVQSA